MGLYRHRQRQEEEEQEGLRLIEKGEASASFPSMRRVLADGEGKGKLEANASAGQQENAEKERRPEEIEHKRRHRVFYGMAADRFSARNYVWWPLLPGTVPLGLPVSQARII